MNKNMDKIDSFRAEFGLDENEYSNEKIFKSLRKNDFDFEQAFGSFFD